MLLSYETSSISYDTIDLIHGKFIPARANPENDCAEYACSRYKLNGSPVRVFINIYGVFADLSGRFSQRYDEHVIPCVTECVLDPNYVYMHIPKVGVDAMMEEDGFWVGMKAYPWYMLMMQEIYNISKGDYYFLLPQYEYLQLEDRLVWVKRHFGTVSMPQTLLLNGECAKLLIKSRNDVFIGSDLYHCEKWSQAGGSAFWWPELSGKCKEPAKYLSKRVRLLGQAVRDLRELSK